MITEKKIKGAFGKAKKDMDVLRYECSNSIRYANYKLSEMDMRIRELERRVAQTERIAVKTIVGEQE